MDIEILDDRIIIHCAHTMDKNSVLHQLSLLYSSLDANKPIYLACDQVSIIDTAAIQLLIHFFQTADRKNISLQWQSFSPTLYKVASILGAKEILRLENMETNL